MVVMVMAGTVAKEGVQLRGRRRRGRSRHGGVGMARHHCARERGRESERETGVLKTRRTVFTQRTAEHEQKTTSPCTERVCKTDMDSGGSVNVAEAAAQEE